ncbi:DUF4097 family beta strand repeat-containing protein [Lacticaseibacillus pabuli]|uniref:DUF4097 family beta strand repeat-containing protein n=1 Tax=Lacticaseibacillus pabuli TaxID=3025672 RepID=A0ABY7WMQ1_9LACO|nr:DUF4097 family beta strand repeat-containing protein [Lacticaseibacillus sp. KACC 23028]WDF81507.1 DUF4097 family beta strand repeat-containing protein [Lacticaseibacillus sp. KACC 23028]
MKRTFIIGLVTLFVGCVFASVGYSQGGLRSVYWDHGLHIDKHINQTVKIKQISKIEINGTFQGRVVIHQGNVAQTSVRTSSRDTVGIRELGKRLIVTSRNKPVVLLSNSGENDSTVLEITVPSKTTIKALSINGAPDVQVNQLTLQKLTNQGGGDLAIANTTISKQFTTSGNAPGDLTLNHVNIPSGLNYTGNGDLTVRNSQFIGAASRVLVTAGDSTLTNNHWSKLTLSSTSGDMTLTNNVVSAQLKARATDGDINATITPQPNNTIATSTQDGDTNLYGAAKQTNYGHFKQGQARYQFNTTSGDIVVKK